MRVSPGSRSGIALLDSMVALAVLGSAGLAVVSLLHQAIASVRVARVEEERNGDADRVLTALSLLGRQELDQRIGPHPLGEFVIDIERPEPVLYRIAIADSAAPGDPLLVTIVYRTREEGL